MFIWSSATEEPSVYYLFFQLPTLSEADLWSSSVTYCLPLQGLVSKARPMEGDKWGGEGAEGMGGIGEGEAGQREFTSTASTLPSWEVLHI